MGTNDILRASDLVQTGKITFDKLQTTFEVARVAVNIIVCWLFGTLSDVLYARLWKGKINSDLKQVFLLYSIGLLSMLLFSLALTTDNVIFYITTMPMMTGMIFMYFLTGVVINFPVESHGILYGTIELIGSIIAFSQQSLIDHIKSLEQPLPFYMACQWVHTGLALLTSLLVIP